MTVGEETASLDSSRWERERTLIVCLMEADGERRL